MRISTAAAQQSALLDLMKSQRESFEANQQLSTGKKAPDLKGYGYDVESIMSARNAMTRTQGYIDGARRLENRLSLQDQALLELSEVAKELRVALTTAEASFLMTDVESLFERAVAALNTTLSGSYIFGGTRTDTEPFTADTLADLQAAPGIGDLFQNSGRRQEMLIDVNQTVEVGPLASDIATELMGVFERIADFDQGPNGPFDGMPDATQQAFLTTEIQNAISAFDTINALTAENGETQARIERQIETHIERIDYFQLLVSDLEDVDMAEAATRLTQAQNAIQVSAATFSQLSQLSLLPYIR